MANRPQTVRIPLLSKSIFLVGLIAFAGFGDSSESTAEPLTATHQAFIDTSLQDLAHNILDGFQPNRVRPLVIVPDTVNDPRHVFAAAVTSNLSGRGMLIREGDEGDGWLMRYVFDSTALTLSNPQRRKFLGSVWLQRAFHPVVTVTIHDQVDTVEVWRQTADTTYTDWVRRSDLRKLEGLTSAGLSPTPPNNAIDRAVIPVATGLAAAVLTITFLLLR